MPKFYMIIGRKIFFPNLGACATCPPSPTPMNGIQPVTHASTIPSSHFGNLD